MHITQVENINRWMESTLLAHLGELGKKLHTGRNHNDQVAMDSKLSCKKRANALNETLHQRQWTLVTCTKQSQDSELSSSSLYELASHYLCTEKRGKIIF